MKRWTKIAIAAGLLGAVAVGTIAWGGKAARRHWGKHLAAARIEQALDYIDATPQQQQLVTKIKDDLFAKLQAKAKANRGVRDQIAEMLAAKDLDVKGLDKLVDDKTDQMRALAHEIVADVAQIHDALTQEQRDKLYARFKEMRARRQERRGGFGGQED